MEAHFGSVPKITGSIHGRSGLFPVTPPVHAAVNGYTGFYLEAKVGRAQC